MYTYYLHTCFKEQLKYDEDNSRRDVVVGPNSAGSASAASASARPAWRQCRAMRALPTDCACDALAAAALVPQLAAAVVVGLLFLDGECAFILLNVLVRLLLLLHKN